MTETDWQIIELDEHEPLPTTTGEDDSSEPEGIDDENVEGGVEPTDFNPDEGPADEDQGQARGGSSRAIHKQSDYGPDPHAGANRNNAAARGWGSGWPNCDRAKQVKVKKAGVMVVVRREIAELVAVLFEATEKRYSYDIKSGQTWGFACRPIRGSTTTASNHSWGLAVDINSLANPMGAPFRSDMPPSMVRMWEACGFYWGGRYTARPDAMHYEYIFRAADVPGHLRKAKAFLAGGTITPPPPVKIVPGGYVATFQGTRIRTGPNLDASVVRTVDAGFRIRSDATVVGATYEAANQRSDKWLRVIEVDGSPVSPSLFTAAVLWRKG
jgi:hypothetical protein